MVIADKQPYGKPGIRRRTLVAFCSQRVFMMRDGTVLPNGEEIKRRRLALGWTQEDLSRESLLSKKTVENAEAGKPTFVNRFRFWRRRLGMTFSLPS